MENPVEVRAEERHSQEIQEGKPFCLETVGISVAVERAVLELSLVARSGRLVEIHVLGYRHENAFVALDSVTGFYLRPGEDCREKGEDGNENQIGKWRKMLF